MAQSTLPDNLRPLVEQLKQLTPAERSLVVDAASESQRKPLPTVPWSEVRRIAGIASIGGNAVEDCEAIYDDV